MCVLFFFTFFFTFYQLLFSSGQSFQPSSFYFYFGAVSFLSLFTFPFFFFSGHSF